MSMLRIILLLLVVPTVLLMTSLTVVHHDAAQAANYGNRIARWPQVAFNIDCDPESVLLSNEDVPDGLMLEREVNSWLFENSLRRTFRGALSQRDPQSSTELVIQVMVMPSGEESGEHMQGIRSVLELLERTYVQWDGLVGEETLVIREYEEIADEPARERIDIHFRVGPFVGSVFWEDDAGWSNLDSILELARTMEARMVACRSMQ